MEIYQSKEVARDTAVVRRPAPQDLAVYTAHTDTPTTLAAPLDGKFDNTGDLTQLTLADPTFDGTQGANVNPADDLLPGTTVVPPAAPEPTATAEAKEQGGLNGAILNSATSEYEEQLLEQQRRILTKAFSGDTSFDLTLTLLQPGASPKDRAKAVLASQGISNPTDHNLEVAEAQIKSGASPSQVADAVRHDPIVFDLSGDGRTDATSAQSGIEVDGSTHTAWAAKGDGVLAFGEHPVDTLASDGTVHADAYATLKHEAQAAGIDTSKGYLDAADIKTLEAKGLTMMVSKGDGTNDMVKPSDLGITKMSLGGSKVNAFDSTGKSTIDSQGSFERNGQTGIANDMSFAEIPEVTTLSR